jgi:outer membrane protein TolC
MRGAFVRNAKRGTLAVASIVGLLLSSGAVRADAGLTLDEAVRLALSRNERARIADEQILVADAAVEKARVAFLPTVTGLGTDVARPYDVVKNGTTVTPYNAVTGSGTIAQPVVNLPAWPLYRQAQRLLDAQRATSADAKRVLQFNAASAFINALSLEAVVAAANRRLDTAKATLVDTQARVDAQLNSSNDVTRAQLDLSSAVQEVASDQGNVQQAYVALAFVVNAPVSPPLAPPTPTLEGAIVQIGAIDRLVAAAEARRLDLVAAKHTARAAHLYADEPLLRIVPTLGIAGAVVGQSLPFASGRNVDETLTTTLTWQVYDAGNRYADKHSRDSAAIISDLTEITLERQVKSDVEIAAAALTAAQGAYRAASDAVVASEKNVGETATLYRQGLATALELTDANDSRFEAEVGFSGAQYAMALAYLALRQAMGLEPLGTGLQ